MPGDRPVVAILADDLIWASRLSDAVEASGASPARFRRLDDLLTGLAAAPGPTAAIVDLTARAYDGIEAVRAASAASVRVLAVGQHDDIVLRKAALASGAERVVPYRKLFEDGPATIGAWLVSGAPAPGAARRPR